MAEPKTALVPLGPIDLAEIPDAGNEALTGTDALRASARKLLKRSALAASFTLLYCWMFMAFGSFPTSLLGMVLALIVGCAVTGAGMYAMYGLPAAILKLAATSRCAGLPYWSNGGLALEEGDIRRAARSWNEAYGECRKTLESIDGDTRLGPREAESIAATVRDLEKTRTAIVARIRALKAMVPPPPVVETIDLEMWKDWPRLGDGTDSSGPK